ncbi:hypothetical protein QZH41_006079 [Actinostola sp. cb2023]|nr:hypothetical protein QZH41_006079 [Actinostola sp. cb2023]
MIEQDQYDITLVNRGNWYFDSKERIKRSINHHFICDRDKALKLECSELIKSGHYDIVIDFSSYTARQIQQVVSILKNRVGLYIFISSDSIYEVCQKDHVAATREEDAVRPKSPKIRMQLRKTETYGHEKLACEEVLRKQRKSGGFPYVALRLPDVIGPRDGSFRFWTYQLWINTHDTIGEKVPLPMGVADLKFSLVHVEDVAKIVGRVIELGAKSYDQALNVAFDKHFTLKSLLEDIGKQLGIKKVNFLANEDEAWYTYPTVTKGPLDINRAKLLLDWDPMPWERALVTLTTFFDDAMTDTSLASEREMVIADVIENLVPEEKYYSYLQGLKKVYGENVFDGLDLDIGFARDAMEIEGENKTIQDNENSSVSEEYVDVSASKNENSEQDHEETMEPEVDERVKSAEQLSKEEL